jgi:AraC-like DNA-binding protein
MARAKLSSNNGNGMSITAPKLSDVPRFEHIVTREDQSFLWRRDDYPWERNVWNYHPEVEIHLIRNASGIAFVGDHIGEFGPGHLAIVGGGLPHDWVTTLNPGQRIEGRDVILQFDAARILRFRDQIPELAELDGFMHRIQRGVAFTGQTAVGAGALLERIGELEGLQRLIGFLELLQMMASAQDYVLLSSAHFMPDQDGETLAMLQRSLIYIGENFTNELPLGEVAHYMAMTESQFSRFFKRNTGNTFTDYLTAMRLHKSCSLLAEDQHSITDICFMSGYTNISNFNRRFRERYGMTPRDYRNRSEERRRLEASRQTELTVRH